MIRFLLILFLLMPFHNRSVIKMTNASIINDINMPVMNTNLVTS
jgi:hypothetical protein